MHNKAMSFYQCFFIRTLNSCCCVLLDLRCSLGFHVGTVLYEEPCKIEMILF